MRDRNKKPELLIPASSLEVLKVAVLYGADAVLPSGPSRVQIMSQLFFVVCST